MSDLEKWTIIDFQLLDKYIIKITFKDGKTQIIDFEPVIGSGWICRGPFPIDNGQRVGLVWLAFLGGGYVAPHRFGMPPNLLAPLPRRDPGAWATDFKYKLLNDSLSPLIASGSFVLE